MNVCYRGQVIYNLAPNDVLALGVSFVYNDNWVWLLDPTHTSECDVEMEPLDWLLFPSWYRLPPTVLPQPHISYVNASQVDWHHNRLPTINNPTVPPLTTQVCNLHVMDLSARIPQDLLIAYLITWPESTAGKTQSKADAGEMQLEYSCDSRQVTKLFFASATTKVAWAEAEGLPLFSQRQPDWEAAEENHIYSGPIYTAGGFFKHYGLKPAPRRQRRERRFWSQ